MRGLVFCSVEISQSQSVNLARAADAIKNANKLRDVEYITGWSDDLALRSNSPMKRNPTDLSQCWLQLSRCQTKTENSIAVNKAPQYTIRAHVIRGIGVD